MNNKLLQGALALLLGAACCPRAHAQNYSIDRYKIAGGGGTSTNGQYSISGTIGQVDATAILSGGGYSMTGGFWSLYAVQTAWLPILNIRYSGGSAIVFWPNTATCTLQQCANLTADSWTNSNLTVTTLNGTNSVTIPAPAGKWFFRLAQ